MAYAQDSVVDDRATVHVIDDDEAPREGLGQLFPSVGLAVRTYVSVQEFLDAGAHDGPGCIVLDVRLPGISGLDFQSRRERLGIRLPIVLMTGHGDVAMSVRAMKAGAIDFLSKPFREQDMIDAVTAALKRDRERRAAERAAANLHERYASLSLREKQVMALVTAGRMNKQVGFDLGLSEITVKLYRRGAMNKMAARTFADLVRMADALGDAAAFGSATTAGRTIFKDSTSSFKTRQTSTILFSGTRVA
jgi:FixJ family two-component response regulator